MDDLLLTIEMIMDPIDFVMCLLSRLAQAFKAVPGWSLEEEINPEVVKMRGLIVLQHWAGLNGPDISLALDISIRKTVIEAIDTIWQQSRTLSKSDQRFLIKIRRLFDPLGEISPVNLDQDQVNQERSSDQDDENGYKYNNYGNGNGNDNDIRDSSSVFDSDSIKTGGETDKIKWHNKLKLRLKSIFTSKQKLPNFHSPQNTSRFTINSFSSDVECEQVSSVLMREKSKNLAVILAVLEWDLFHSIHRSELVIFPSARESPQRLAEECPNLQRSIEHFNSMCQWFVQLISTQEDETPLLAKLIRLAVKCVMIHNYNTALQIILALQSPGVTSRTDLWMSLPAWERRLAKDLVVFGSPVKNFRNVRRALEDVQKEEIPVIPFNGLFLSDLVFNWERSYPQNINNNNTNTNNTNNSNNNNNIINNNNNIINNNNNNVKLIPFYKNHMASKIIRQFLAFQQARHGFERILNSKERQLYSYFADIGRLGGEFTL